MGLSQRSSRAVGLGLWLAALAGCTTSPYIGFDGGPCTWSFPNDDPCAASGLVCRRGPSYQDNSTICQLPGELFRCSTEHGCNGSYLSCVEVPVEGVGPTPLCVRSCSKAGSSSDCPDPFSFCQELPDGGGNACLLAACIGAYQLASCQVGDATPGTCLPLRVSSASLAFCQAAGTAPAGADCQTGADYGPLCAPGMVCISQLCFPVCNRATEPACPTGTVCSPPYIVNESAAFFDGTFSLCLATCSLDAGVGCAAPLSCVEQPGTQGYCLP